MNRKRTGAVVAIALLAGLLWLVVRSPRSSVQAVAVADEASGAGPASPAPGPQAPVARIEPAAVPVIEAISVEKTEVCRNEENLVTVRLASAFAGDDTVRIMMPGQDVAGPQMPFRLSFSGDKQQPEMPEVVVFGREGLLATVKIPPVTVKDCEPGPSLIVQIASMANAPETFAFTATVHNPGNHPFKPVEWRWDFGDGTDATTKVRTVQHGYEDRPQTTRISPLLIHVRAVDAQGVEALGRYGLELRNPAWEALHLKNTVMLSTELNPRFPEMGADGRVVQRVRIHHAYDKPVTVERVLLQRFRKNEQGHEEVQEAAVDPREILGATVIPPGRGIEVTATLDTRAEPGIGLLTFDLVGKSGDGIRASGQFSVLRPPELIPQAEREIVTDARLRAEILAVRKLVGRDEVTMDEIMQLRREGALDDLTGDDGQPLKAAEDGELRPLTEQPPSRPGTRRRPPARSR